MTLTLGLALPQVFLDGNVNTRLIADVAQGAEAAGFETLWVQEQLLGRVAVLDALALLDYASALTSRIRLGLGVVVLSRHDPVQLAKRVASLDALSGGRVEFGVGIGGRPPAAPGASSGRPVRRFNEALDVIQALWTGEPTTYEGEVYRIDGAQIAPSPVQRPRPPLWMGASSTGAIRRAVRRADGWMGAGSTSLDEFRSHVRVLADELDQAGRARSQIRVAKRLYVLIDDDADRAKARARDWFQAYYRNADMADRVAVAGTWEDCARVIDEVAACGADHILLSPLLEARRHLEVFERNLSHLLRSANEAT